MNKLNKLSYALAVSALTISTGTMAGTVGTMNTFTVGSPAVAADVNDNFTEQTTQINDNDGRITAAESSIVAVEASIATVGEKDTANLISYAKMRVPNLSPVTPGDTTVQLLFANTTGVDCDMTMASTTQDWSLGTNTFGSVSILPTYNTSSFPAKTSTATPFISTTTTLIARNYNVGDISSNAFTNLTVLRKETISADTCGPTDVVLYGARMTTPGGWYSIPLSTMDIK